MNLSSRKALGNKEAGQIRKDTVRHLTNFGAFVDLGGVDGLLHICGAVLGPG